MQTRLHQCADLTACHNGFRILHGRLQSLGIAFGDTLAQEMGLHWVAVEDEYGRDPALQDPGTAIVMFPLTTISKRIERGETVDVRNLFEDACNTLTRLRAEGRYTIQ